MERDVIGLDTDWQVKMGATRIDTSKFNAMCLQGSRMSAVPYEPFVRNEVGRTMEQTIKNTKSLNVAGMNARFENAQFSQQPATLYTPETAAGRRHRSQVRLSQNGSIKYKLKGFRYPSALWSAIQARRRAHLARIKGARGLAQRSWLKIAQALELSIKAPAYVGRAIASTGKEYADTSVAVQSSEAKVSITISNSQPTAIAIGGEDALRKAVAGRVKYFEQNIKFRVFNDLAKIAKAYPGLRVALPQGPTT